MKKVAIVQARMGSSRLPGKILKQVMSKPLLEYQIERIKRSKLIDEIIIATTIKESDEPIVEFANKNGLSMYRGSENDVLSRFVGAAKDAQADVVIRLTSDCPVLDPEVIDIIINEYLHTDFDYVSNTMQRSYPRGMDVEVFSYELLKEIDILAKDVISREHVTPFIYNNPEIYKLKSIMYDEDYSKYRLTVDTKEDFEIIEAILTNVYPENSEFNLEDIIVFLNANPEIAKINSHIEQKKLGE
jgi:spore coat polysaccharide biosynthesis protein SpsF